MGLLERDAAKYLGMKLSDIPDYEWYLSRLGFMNGLLGLIGLVFVINGDFDPIHNFIANPKFSVRWKKNLSKGT